MKRVLFTLFFVAVFGRYLLNDCHFQRPEIFCSTSTLRIVSRASSSPFLPSSASFPENAEIGVFVLPSASENTASSSFSIPQVRAKAFPAAHQRIEWKCTPAVSLSSDAVRVYAYHPYQPTSSIHPRAIPIHISTDAGQTPDYKHGTLPPGHKRITSSSSLAMISWKSVLPVVSFEIYAGCHTLAPTYLKAIQIRNQAGGNAFCQRGFLDGISGEITPFFAVPGATFLRMSAPTPLRKSESSRYEFRVMPLDPVRTDGEIEFVFSIDEKTYTYAVPARTSWKKGYRYFYRFVFTGDEVHLQTSSIQPFF